MTVAYYLAPVEQAQRGNRRPWESRVLGYAAVAGAWTTSVVPDLGVKQWCLTGVDCDDALHAQIKADGQIIELPFGPADLDGRVTALPVARRNAIATALGNRRIPTAWIGAGTTNRQLLKHLMKVFYATQRLGADFPEMALTFKWSDLGAAQRDKIQQFLAAGKVDVSDLRAALTVEDLLHKLVAWPWEFAGIFQDDPTATDTFDRSSGAVGSDWTVINGTAGTDTGAPPAVTNAGWRIYSNALVMDASARSDTFFMRWAGATQPGTNNYYVEAGIDKATDNDNAIGVCWRIPTTGTGDTNCDGYTGYPYSDLHYLMRIADSGETSLASGTATDANAHTLRGEGNGNAQRLLLDTAQILTATDSTYASGAVGVSIGAYGSADGAAWTTWTFSDLSNPASLTPTAQSRLPLAIFAR
jgi:hypothetical protein